MANETTTQTTLSIKMVEDFVRPKTQLATDALRDYIKRWSEHDKTLATNYSRMKELRAIDIE